MLKAEKSPNDFRRADDVKRTKWKQRRKWVPTQWLVWMKSVTYFFFVGRVSSSRRAFVLKRDEFALLCVRSIALEIVSRTNVRVAWRHSELLGVLYLVRFRARATFLERLLLETVENIVGNPSEGKSHLDVAKIHSSVVKVKITGIVIVIKNQWILNHNIIYKIRIKLIKQWVSNQIII